MKFASVKQIILLTAITCLGLFGLDYYKNPQLWHSRQSASMARPGIRLTLWMNHLCCLGCLADVRQALAEIPGIDLANATDPKQLLTQAEANMQGASLPEYGNETRWSYPFQTWRNWISLPSTGLSATKGLLLDAWS